MSQLPDPATRKRQHRNPRYDFRARSHETAHANGAAAPVPKIPDHPLICKNPPELISTPESLAELIGHLRAVGTFAYDSEFIGELSYFPKLCLIQVATHQRIALVDALAELDLSPFWQLIIDPTIEKVVHAGQQDLEPAFRLAGQPPANIFDTQVAAGFIGLAYPVGLSKLVRELVGVHLGKGFTFTHWDQRPLSNVQLRYAADDVRYLPALREEIGQRLESRSHAAWAAEECTSLCNPRLYSLDPALDYMRIRGVNSLSPHHVAILRELVIWREAAARKYDSPPRSYTKDEILVEMARNPVTTVAALSRVRGLPRPVEEAEGSRIVEAVQRALALPEADWPVIVQNEETPTERFASDALWATVQVWCQGNQIDPNLATSRQEVGRLYRELRRGESVPDHRLMCGWRNEFLGQMLLGLLQGELSLNLQWKQGALQARQTASAEQSPA